MPAQNNKKISPQEKARDEVISLLAQVHQQLKMHYNLADQNNFQPKFIHRSGGGGGGMMQHHSKYEIDALEVEFEAFGERCRSIMRLLKDEQWRTYNVQAKICKLNSHVQKYLQIFEQDYCFFGVLWMMGGSLGISDKTRQAAKEAEYQAEKLTTAIEKLQDRIVRALKTMEKRLDQKQKKEVSCSPKAKRATVTAKAKRAQTQIVKENGNVN